MKKTKKTKILAIGDLHGDTGLVKKLAKKAEEENVDLVILAGDLTLFEASTKNLVGPFLKSNKQVLIIPGNHESKVTADFLAEMYAPTKNIHGSSFRKNDVGIFGAGGGDIGIYKIKDKDLLELLRKGHAEIKDSKKKIMVTHMHHHGGGAEFSGFAGSKAVKRAIKEFNPDLLISAHIHEARGIEERLGKTRIINVSRKPRIIEI